MASSRRGRVADWGMRAKDKSNKTVTFYTIHTTTERTIEKCFTLLGSTGCQLYLHSRWKYGIILHGVRVNFFPILPHLPVVIGSAVIFFSPEGKLVSSYLYCFLKRLLFYLWRLTILLITN